MKRYNKWEEETQQKKETGDKIDSFVELFCEGLREHEIKNELKYFVSVCWDLSYKQKDGDLKWLEKTLARLEEEKNEYNEE